MFNRKLTSILLVVFALTLFGCSTETPATITVQSNPPALANINTASLTTPFPITLTPTSEPSLDATDTPSETPDATTTITDTATVTETATITPTPTAPPPLPLRDDLPPMELQDFPRPKDDNGLGIHFLATGYYNEQDLDKQIARIQALHLKWATVVYTDENHLEIAAQKFSQSGIMVIWRKTLHPYQRYSSWGRDIEILKKYGIPPYIQLYNEPELPAEWDNKEINMNLFFNNLIGAAKDVYNAGGYPGIQLLDEDDLRHFIDEIYARKGEALFKRMFFIPHAYGLNHPPDYKQDENGVLGFLNFATIFYKRLGFVPPFIVGEGGWKMDSAEDNRFPPISDQLHRDYTLAVYDWFRTGKLSNGAKLPDYLFAFNMWMLSGPDEAGAWYDSFKGDRTLTIGAVTQIPPFIRKFSWDK
ncbi:MAG TPA: hypothetical protein VFD70_16950 [Anaerolineae bacterium]|nr:hypothetical protein [Anaerolineae bacterium]